MDIERILESVRSGELTVGQAKKMLSLYSVKKIGDFARIDTDRQKRRGVPEVVYAQGKTASETREIVAGMMAESGPVVVSRIREEDHSGLVSFARGEGWNVSCGKTSTSILIYDSPPEVIFGTVGIMAAGTSDIGVAEEARLVCEAMGCSHHAIYDAGVAGIQRVFDGVREMIKRDADAIVVVAGMEGALATVVSSLVDVPVVGVPASVGYGYGGEGVAALASMLQSCSLGMAVVNIDNGIGAGAVAASIARRAGRRRDAAAPGRAGQKGLP